jgi:hypothetical protein
VAIIDAELSRLKVTENESGSIRTVFADGEALMALQWGDEVFVSAEHLVSRGIRLRERIAGKRYVGYQGSRGLRGLIVARRLVVRGADSSGDGSVDVLTSAS